MRAPKRKSKEEDYQLDDIKDTDPLDKKSRVNIDQNPLTFKTQPGPGAPGNKKAVKNPFSSLDFLFEQASAQKPPKHSISPQLPKRPLRSKAQPPEPKTKNWQAVPKHTAIAQNYMQQTKHLLINLLLTMNNHYTLDSEKNQAAKQFIELFPVFTCTTMLNDIHNDIIERTCTPKQARERILTRDQNILQAIKRVTYCTTNPVSRNRPKNQTSHAIAADKQKPSHTKVTPINKLVELAKQIANTVIPGTRASRSLLLILNKWGKNKEYNTSADNTLFQQLLCAYGMLPSALKRQHTALNDQQINLLVAFKDALYSKATNNNERGTITRNAKKMQRQGSTVTTTRLHAKARPPSEMDSPSALQQSLRL